jgi:hypothetical protein
MAKTTLNITMDQAQIANINLMMGDIKNGVPKVMVRAINATLTGVQSDAVKAIAVDLNLTQERIRQDFYINKATWEYISGSVVAKGKPVNLASFQGTTENRSDFNGGVSVKIKKSGTRQKFKHAFIWTRGAGGFTVNPISGGISENSASTMFERQWHDYHTFRSYMSPWKKFGPKYRLPLETMTGPRIEDEFAKDRVIKSVEIEAKGRIDANMAHELDYELSKLR